MATSWTSTSRGSVSFSSSGSGSGTATQTSEHDLSLGVYTPPSSETQDGVGMALTGEAFAVGEQTIAEGDIDLEIIDLGTTTVASGSSSFSASSQSNDSSTSYASAETSAAVTPGGKIVAWSLETSSTSQSEDQSEWTASSTTGSFVVYDSAPGAGTDSSSLDTSTDDSNTGRQESVGSLEQSGSGDVEIHPFSAWEIDLGNIAVLDIDASAFGQDTYVSVDGSILTVENQLSTVSGSVFGAIG